MDAPWRTAAAEFAGRRVVVAGLARSGRAVGALLARHGAAVTGTDVKDAAALGWDTAAWPGRDLVLGGPGLTALDGAEILVVSPGIPKTAPLLAEAARRGIPRLSELEVASRFARAPILAVTGTNGKSTTVTALGDLVRGLGRPVEVAGNVGRAFSEVVESVPETGVLVVEVSSYQLEDIERFHPRGATILNVTPDHLDRYDSFDHYRRTKLRIFQNQTPGDTAVIPDDDASLRDVAGSLVARRVGFGEPGASVTPRVSIEADGLWWVEGGARRLIVAGEALPLRGPHNLRNLAAALGLLRALDVDPASDPVRGGLAGVRPLVHRLEPAGTVAGVAFYNDSKATNPDSVAVALRSFEDPIVLIAGGLAKDADYGALVPLIHDHVVEVVLIGEASALLAGAWGSSGIPMHHAGDMTDAAGLAFRRARALGAVVLLSPGCASFDMFRDFEDRGERFKAAVRGLGEEG